MVEKVPCEYGAGKGGVELRIQRGIAFCVCLWYVYLIMQTLTLSPVVSDLLAQVASRLGQSPAMVAEEALRRFIAHQEDVLAEKKRAWDAAVQVGLDDVAAGRVVPWNAETRARIRQKARELVDNNTVPIASDTTP